MTKLEKPGCIIALQYEWKLNYELYNLTEGKVFLSKEIKYKNHGSFQVGFKKLQKSSSSTPTLIFVASNLHKIGLKVESVSFFSSQTLLEFLSGEDKQMDLKF